MASDWVGKIQNQEDAEVSDALEHKIRFLMEEMGVKDILIIGFEPVLQDGNIGFQTSVHTRFRMSPLLSGFLPSAIRTIAAQFEDRYPLPSFKEKDNV